MQTLLEPRIMCIGW